jgi:hypothetical protein
MAVEKYARSGGGGGGGRGGGGGGRGNRRRQNYNVRRSPPFVPSHPPPHFPVYLPPVQRPQGYGGYVGGGGPRQGSGNRAPPGACYDCHENGHHRGDAACKGKKYNLFSFFLSCQNIYCLLLQANTVYIAFNYTRLPLRGSERLPQYRYDWVVRMVRIILHKRQLILRLIIRGSPYAVPSCRPSAGMTGWCEWYE